MKPCHSGSFLDVFGELVCSTKRCDADIKLLLTGDHVISLNQSTNLFKRDTCIFCKVANLIPIINHM